METVVIVADLREGAPARERAISLYRALEKSSRARAFFLEDRNVSPREKFNMSGSLAMVKDSVVVLFREVKNYFKIHRSNTVVYLAPSDSIEQFMSFVLPRVDRIIAPDYKAAFALAATVQRLNLQTPVHRLPPWIDSSMCEMHNIDPNGKLSIGVSGDHKLIHALLRMEDLEVTVQHGAPASHDWSIVDEVSPASHDAYLHLEGSPEKVRVAMAHGVIPIARNVSPYAEWIIHGLNGYLVQSGDSLTEVVRLLRNRDHLQIMQKIALGGTGNLTPEAWAEVFLDTVRGDGADDINDETLTYAVETARRKWIIPKVMLEAGREVMIPRGYDESSFQVVPISDLEEILTYFATQLFAEVYVFDWDFGDYDDFERRERILNLSRALGRRALNIFWCSDQETPMEWAAVFKNMTRLSSRDGLNRVASSAQT